MPNITLIGAAQSRAIRNLWMLEELGLAYEHDKRTPSDPAMKTAPYTALNPNGRIPILVVDGFPVYESLAINLYLAQKFPGVMTPRGIEETATATQWSCWAMSDLDGLMTQWALNTVIKPEAERDPAQAADALHKLIRPLAALEAVLRERQWLVGDRFTVADLNVASVLGRALAWDLAETPALKAWLARCWSRPAAIAARRLRGDAI